MTRTEAEKLSRTEESWRVEVLWRLDNLTWNLRQMADGRAEVVELLRRVVEKRPVR